MKPNPAILDLDILDWAKARIRDADKYAMTKMSDAYEDYCAWANSAGKPIATMCRFGIVTNFVVEKKKVQTIHMLGVKICGEGVSR